MFDSAPFHLEPTRRNSSVQDQNGGKHLMGIRSLHAKHPRIHIDGKPSTSVPQMHLDPTGASRSDTRNTFQIYSILSWRHDRDTLFKVKSQRNWILFLSTLSPQRFSELLRIFQNQRKPIS